MPTSHAASPGPSSATDADRPSTLSCVLVEDQGLFLELLSGMLHLRGGLKIAATAMSMAEGRAACRKHRPDVLMLDLDLPDGNGLDVARDLIKLNPEARIIVISGHATNFVCPAWLNENLQAIISKNDTFESLRHELDDLLAVEATSVRPLKKAKFAESPLSEREAEILALIGEGLTSKEIGARLFISEHTVQAHRKRIAVKLGTRGQELTQRAIAQRGTFFSPEKDRS